MSYQILLVDDDPNIIDGIEYIINDHFPGVFQADKAYDGRQALELLTRSYYHLIVSDIKMPQLDGIHLLELLHREQIPSTILMLSGYDDYMYIRSALKLGAYDYLLKPVNIQSFVEMITDLLPKLTDSGARLPKSCLSAPTQSNPAADYFDLPNTCGSFLTLEELNLQLEKLQSHILELNSEEVCTGINYIFHHLSEQVITRDQLKKSFADFTYSLMQKNASLIKIIAQYKLTENDLSAQIKNQPHLSQLKEKFRQILLLYIDQLAILQKNNEEYVVKKALQYIHSHYSDQLLLADIAAQFRLHPNYFSSLFKKQMNVTVRDYILKLRVDKAKELMKDSSLKLIDIALAVGYQDAAHFNRAFKNVTGISPSQYRSGVEMD